MDIGLFQETIIIQRSTVTNLNGIATNSYANFATPKGRYSSPTAKDHEMFEKQGFQLNAIIYCEVVLTDMIKDRIVYSGVNYDILGVVELKELGGTPAYLKIGIGKRL